MLTDIHISAFPHLSSNPTTVHHVTTHTHTHHPEIHNCFSPDERTDKALTTINYF